MKSLKRTATFSVNAKTAFVSTSSEHRFRVYTLPHARFCMFGDAEDEQARIHVERTCGIRIVSHFIDHQTGLSAPSHPKEKWRGNGSCEYLKNKQSTSRALKSLSL